MLGSFKQTTVSKKVPYELTATNYSGDSDSLNRTVFAEWKWTTEVGRRVLVNVAVEDMGHAAEQTFAIHVAVIL